nr:nicotinamide riboside transporter PnuC [Endozoicomonas sp. OPT23]
MTIIGILFVLGVAFSIPESQLFGAAFVSILGYLSFEADFYVNAVTNIGLLAPLSIWGYLNWQKRAEHGQLEASLPVTKLLWVLGITTVAVFIIYAFSGNWNGYMPFLDALTGVLPIVATLLMVLAYREQWLFWIPFNALQAYMWFGAASLAPDVVAVFILKLVFLLNSLIGFHYWRKKVT